MIERDGSESIVAQKELWDYYFRELEYLRDAGNLFAKDFPQVAGRLSLDGGTSTDPHIERLLESFAFLSARLQKNIDNTAKKTTDELLNVLYPHINKPLPALTIAQFQVHSGGKAPPPEGAVVPSKTEIFVYSPEDHVCKFRTVYPLQLLPITIENVEIVTQSQYNFVPVPNTVEFGYKQNKENPPYFLEITLKSNGPHFSTIHLQSITFYLSSSDVLFKKQIYQSLFSGKSLIYAIRGEDTKAFPLLPQALRPMGFEREEMAIPQMEHETHAYQILQEFFHVPDKFMFFNVHNLEMLKHLRKGVFLDTGRLRLLFPLHHAVSEWSRKLQRHDVMIHCTPAVNLFKNTTEPISWDRKKTFYSLSPHAQKSRVMEIYQIDEVQAVDANTGKEKRVCPYFSLEFGSEDREATWENLYWYSQMEPTKYKNIVGVDTFVSFIDTNLQRVDPTEFVFYAKTLCTNRFLAEDIQQNTNFQVEAALPVRKIVCLQRPVFPQYSLDKGLNNVKLISLLSLNYLGFPYGNFQNTLDSLKSILSFHMGDSQKEYGQNLLREVSSLRVTPLVKHGGREAWRGFMEGILVAITIKKSQYLADWFLLAKVLHRYFAINCQMNSFVDLQLNEGTSTIANFETVLGELGILS
jgi:type VI secretion system protein ImpG